jgi:hypothetical protein
MTWPPWNYRRCKISHPFYCKPEDDVASQEVQKVQYITSFLLQARRLHGIIGTTEGSGYHILFIASQKMTWHPWNYRRFEISHPFDCKPEGDVASMELQKVQDITSFSLQ